jgi:hypothetical protein
LYKSTEGANSGNGGTDLQHTEDMVLTETRVPERAQPASNFSAKALRTEEILYGAALCGVARQKAATDLQGSNG